MQVSKFRHPTSKRLQYRVYSQYRPFDIINDFLRHLEKKDFAANTVRASAYDLIRYFTRVGQALQLKHQDIESWKQRLLIEYRIDNENEVYAKSYKPIEIAGLCKACNRHA